MGNDQHKDRSTNPDASLRELFGLNPIEITQKPNFKNLFLSDNLVTSSQSAHLGDFQSRTSRDGSLWFEQLQQLQQPSSAILLNELFSSRSTSNSTPQYFKTSNSMTSLASSYVSKTENAEEDQRSGRLIMKQKSPSKKIKWDLQTKRNLNLRKKVDKAMDFVQGILDSKHHHESRIVLANSILTISMPAKSKLFESDNNNSIYKNGHLKYPILSSAIDQSILMEKYYLLWIDLESLKPLSKDRPIHIIGPELNFHEQNFSVNRFSFQKPLVKEILSTQSLTIDNQEIREDSSSNNIQELSPKFSTVSAGECGDASDYSHFLKIPFANKGKFGRLSQETENPSRGILSLGKPQKDANPGDINDKSSQGFIHPNRITFAPKGKLFTSSETNPLNFTNEPIKPYNPPSHDLGSNAFEYLTEDKEQMDGWLGLQAARYNHTTNTREAFSDIQALKGSNEINSVSKDDRLSRQAFLPMQIQLQEQDQLLVQTQLKPQTQSSIQAQSVARIPSLKQDQLYCGHFEDNSNNSHHIDLRLNYTLHNHIPNDGNINFENVIMKRPVNDALIITKPDSIKFESDINHHNQYSGNYGQANLTAITTNTYMISPQLELARSSNQSSKVTLHDQNNNNLENPISSNSQIPVLAVDLLIKNSSGISPKILSSFNSEKILLNFSQQQQQEALVHSNSLNNLRKGNNISSPLSIKNSNMRDSRDRNPDGYISDKMPLKLPIQAQYTDEKSKENINDPMHELNMSGFKKPNKQLLLKHYKPMQENLSRELTIKTKPNADPLAEIGMTDSIALSNIELASNHGEAEDADGKPVRLQIDLSAFLRKKKDDKSESSVCTSIADSIIKRDQNPSSAYLHHPYQQQQPFYSNELKDNTNYISSLRSSQSQKTQVDLNISDDNKLNSLLFNHINSEKKSQNESFFSNPGILITVGQLNLSVGKLASLIKPDDSLYKMDSIGQKTQNFQFLPQDLAIPQIRQRSPSPIRARTNSNLNFHSTKESSRRLIRRNPEMYDFASNE